MRAHGFAAGGAAARRRRPLLCRARCLRQAAPLVTHHVTDNGSANAAYNDLTGKKRKHTNLQPFVAAAGHLPAASCNGQLECPSLSSGSSRCFTPSSATLVGPMCKQQLQPSRRTRALAGRPGRIEGRAGRGRGAGAAAARQHRDLPAQVAVGLLQRRYARMLHSPAPASKLGTYAHRHKHAHNKQSEPQTAAGCGFPLTLTYTHVHAPTQTTLKL